MDSIFEEKDSLMNHPFIEGVIFDCDKLDNDSYVKKIEAFIHHRSGFITD